MTDWAQYKIDIVVAGEDGNPEASSADVDFCEHADEEEFKEELVDCLAATETSTCTISLVPEGTPCTIVPEAFQVALETANECGFSGSLNVLVASANVQQHLFHLTPGDPDSKLDVDLGGIQVRISVCDIITTMADAIVNASNTLLKLGGGVSGTLRRAAGPALQQEMDQLRSVHGQLEVGGVVQTGAGQLTETRVIFHAATASGNPQGVRRAIRSVLSLCGQQEISSVAFPALGTGTGKMASDVCAQIFREEIIDHAGSRMKPFPEVVYLCLWSQPSYNAFAEVFGF